MHHRGVTHLATGDLHAGLDHVRSAPKDDGVVELIVRRPAENEREVVGEAHLDCTDGLVGDTWNVRVSKRTGVGPDSERQLTLMNARAAALVAGTSDHGGLAGDQVYVDFDLGYENIPPGTRLQVGDAVIEVSAAPHTGCAKFRARFGADALRFVNSEVGRELNLRGINAKVVVAGTVRPGDAVRKL
ncbi:MAG: MOSC domain-containing protein [Actinobacteria bacterium]|nr:MAG: MOSC domain-containing protein [Actinomycetota bacterium]